jgi:hypothetical protein
MLPKRSEAMLNTLAPAPSSESLREELFAPVRDKMPGYLPRLPKKSIKKRTNRRRRGLRTIDRESDHAPREMVDGYREPPAKRPDLRQGEGKPRRPEAEGGGNGGQIDVPEVIRFTGGDDATGWLKNLLGLGPPRLLLHPANRGVSEMETRTGEDLGGFHFSQGRTENLEAPHDVTDEVGKLVHRFGQTNQGVESFLIETPHPGGDGKRAHLKDPRRLGERPSPRCPKLENRQPLCRRIMGPSMCLKLLHAGILDSDLFAQQLGFRLEPVAFGLPAELTVQTFRSPTLGQRQGGSGERDDLDYCRADATGPASGQGKRMELRGAGHGQPPQGIQE